MEEAQVFCPATMCPLFAADGSPWTGHKNTLCKQNHEDCAWFHDGGCQGVAAANEQIGELISESRPFVIGKKYSDRKAKPTVYDCPRAIDCQWQLQSKGLCPPRAALALGLDPRACAY